MGLRRQSPPPNWISGVSGLSDQPKSATPFASFVQVHSSETVNARLFEGATLLRPGAFASWMSGAFVQVPVDIVRGLCVSTMPPAPTPYLPSRCTVRGSKLASYLPSFRLVNPLLSLKLLSSKYVYRHISSYFVLEQFLQPKSPRQRHLASSIVQQSFRSRGPTLLAETLRFVGAALTEESGREWCGLSFKHSPPASPPPPKSLTYVLFAPLVIESLDLFLRRLSPPPSAHHSSPTIEWCFDHRTLLSLS
ncbi:hypothetical protein CH63R_04608 [Colletotrichum higginsianum IMI 349063]|uniref:Uncharacterized protein n=1 Tax=Colletotrichum higginsianum (strain IMI 349063) TaxID=759273 RepID=A0A1B7YK31_COLHI|nr:hypothetical protein CH63R_04608 [Colletotrichum higginsianum IMI 349063]OBR12312.1 hypothetical protein CH63R_04608 [Colletotrichum higginsianum IMI 349063]